jgi:cytochrome c biogenesis protein ResB
VVPVRRAADFHADLTAHARPALRAARVLEVNHPVSVGGVRVFLVGNGYAPR